MQASNPKGNTMTFLPPDVEPNDPAPHPATYAVYARIVLYVMSSILAMIPLSWSSWVTYDATTQMVHISVQGLAGAAAMGLIGALAVFRRWGIK
jgi:hypothetical protein